MANETASGFFYSFPAVRGIQAGREYYSTMLPLRLIPRLFLFDEDELEPSIRSQRTLNKSRVPAIARYILEHPTSYVFSALTGSVDAVVEFMPLSDEPMFYNVGSLRVPLNARFVINDGQHRRAGIEMALRENPALGDETIACVLFQDSGLNRSQQMFADLNRYAIRPSASISVLYDHRDRIAELSRRLAAECAVFSGYTELDKSSLSNRSTKIFTLSGIHRATTELLRENVESFETQLTRAIDFWTAVGNAILPWRHVREGLLRPIDLRTDYVVGHSVLLVGLGRVGRTILRDAASDWRERISLLREVDWSRKNRAQWEGRATHGGRVSIAGNHTILVSNELKRILGLPLEPEELAIEQNTFSRGVED